MAYANINRVRTSEILQRLAAMVANVQATRAKSAIYRQTVRELTALSARELTDLGIDRSMIRKIAAEAAYGN